MDSVLVPMMYRVDYTVYHKWHPKHVHMYFDKREDAAYFREMTEFIWRQENPAIAAQSDSDMPTMREVVMTNDRVSLGIVYETRN